MRNIESAVASGRIKLPAAVSEIKTTAVNLVYVSEQGQGITRRRSGKGWSYRAPDGTVIRDAKTLARIRSLAVPPAYKDVWICPEPDGHLQACGRDARGRKQYRYHPAWRETRDTSKYGRVGTFIRALPQLRAQVTADLARHGLPREKVLATVVRLMEMTFIRVGNIEYAKQNKSFGLTTLRNRHTLIQGNRAEFSFKAKSGIKRHVIIRNRQLVGLIKRLRELPGQELFQYLDPDGTRHVIGSSDVNEYLRTATGEEITAKDFRTWAGTYLSVVALAGEEAAETEAARKRAMLRVIEQVAAALGNTPSICRKCYIHPKVFDAHMNGDLSEHFRAAVERSKEKPIAGLTSEEAAVLSFLD